MRPNYGTANYEISDDEDPHARKLFFPQSIPPPPPPEPEKRFAFLTSKVFAVSVIVCMVVAASIATVVVSSSSSSSSSSSIESDISTDSSVVAEDSSATVVVDLSCTLNREGYDSLSFFTDPSSFLTYKFLAGYSAIIEPSAPMMLDVFEGEVSSALYRFTVCDVEGISDCQHGTYSPSTDSYEAVTISCEPHSQYTVSVAEVDSSTKEVLRSMKMDAICMYVRRDIEDLTTTDLHEVLDAMHVLWEYSEEEGQAMYGEDFHSSTYFAEAHHFSAAMRESDHIHEGLGFVAQHIKLTGWFEAAMQAVNSKVTLPYWEFTRDVATNKSIFESIMFSEATFGSLTVPTHTENGFTYSDDSIALGSIPNGRWANVKADVNTRMGIVQSGYGYLKAPWNMNPSPYITRFAASAPSLPTCTEYAVVLASVNTLQFVDNIQKGPHASVHAVIGNVFGCDLLNPMLSDGLLKDKTKTVNLCRQWSYYMKDLYRGNYLTPRYNCSIDFEADSNNLNCAYECTASQYDDLLVQLQSLLESYVPEDGLTDSEWELWRDFVCTGDGYKIIVGTHMDSSSAADPSFWPVHPTQERLLHAHIMASLSATFEWPTDPESEYVCDTASCYESESGTKDYHEICCYGHFENDQFLDFVNADKDSVFGETNSFIMTATNPLSATYSMNYVYDNFEYSHCASEGVDDYLETSYVKAIRAVSESAQ